MLPTLQRQRINEAVFALDLAEHGVFGIAELRESYIRKAVLSEFVAHGSLIPHPPMGRISEPCRQNAGAFQLPHARSFNKGGSVATGFVAVNENGDVWNNEAERAALFQMPEGIAQGNVKVVESQMLKHMRAINSLAFIVKRQSFDDVAIADIRGKAMAVPAIEMSKDRKTLKSERRARVEVHPAIRGDISASVLNVHGINHSLTEPSRSARRRIGKNQ